MNNPQPESEHGENPEIGAAEWLFQDCHSPEPKSGADRLIVEGDGDEFELAEIPPAPAETAAPALPPEPAHDARRSAAGPPSRHRMAPPLAPAVEQVWSRTAEWGPTLLMLAGWLAVIAALLYVTLGAELYSLALLIMVLGGLVAAVLSYPILITLERPVRVTPEQAARDYFNALSHHVPHVRRMWLLLSAQGKTSSRFASYEGFKGYWVERLQVLRQGQAGRFSPLVFQVEEFRAEKSAGKTEIDARFKVKVLLRGRRAEGELWSFPVERSFARGPDGMWYLNDGTLAEPGREAPVASS